MPKDVTYSRIGFEVQEMFGSIAAGYDRANTILSFGIHHLWRKALIASLPKGQKLEILDLCTGTADLIPPLVPLAKRLVGADFSLPMLVQAGKKLNRLGLKAELVQADAQNLPFAEMSFDLITVAFGVRNFENLELGLKEMLRVIKPGATIRILEFGTPPGLFGLIYKFYSDKLLPLIGGLITGNRAAYRYLQKTSSHFPYADQFAAKLSEVGYQDVSYKALTFGICYLYSARRI